MAPLQPAMGVHGLHTRGVVALHAPLSYSPTAHEPAQGAQTRSAKGVHAAISNSPFGQAPEHATQVASPNGVHGVCMYSPRAQLRQALHTVSVAFEHPVFSKFPGAHRVHGVHVLPSPKRPAGHEHGFDVESSHPGGAASGAELSGVSPPSAVSGVSDATSQHPASQSVDMIIQTKPARSALRDEEVMKPSV